MKRNWSEMGCIAGLASLAAGAAFRSIGLLIFAMVCIVVSLAVPAVVRLFRGGRRIFTRRVLILAGMAAVLLTQAFLPRLSNFGVTLLVILGGLVLLGYKGSGKKKHTQKKETAPQKSSPRVAEDLQKPATTVDEANGVYIRGGALYMRGTLVNLHQVRSMERQEAVYQANMEAASGIVSREEAYAARGLVRDEDGLWTLKTYRVDAYLQLLTSSSAYRRTSKTKFFEGDFGKGQGRVELLVRWNGMHWIVEAHCFDPAQRMESDTGVNVLFWPEDRAFSELSQFLKKVGGVRTFLREECSFHANEEFWKEIRAYIREANRIARGHGKRKRA